MTQTIPDPMREQLRGMRPAVDCPPEERLPLIEADFIGEATAMIANLWHRKHYKLLSGMTIASALKTIAEKIRSKGDLL